MGGLPRYHAGQYLFFCDAKRPIRAHKCGVVVGYYRKQRHLFLPQRVEIHIIMVGNGLDLGQVECRKADGGGNQYGFCCFA